jgi:hypothetical protein
MFIALPPARMKRRSVEEYYSESLISLIGINPGNTAMR